MNDPWLNYRKPKKMPLFISAACSLDKQVKDVRDYLSLIVSILKAKDKSVIKLISRELDTIGFTEHGIDKSVSEKLTLTIEDMEEPSPLEFSPQEGVTYTAPLCQCTLLPRRHLLFH